MSWRIAIKALHAIGGTGRVEEFGRDLIDPPSAVRFMRLYGMAVNNGKRGAKGGKSNCIWTITPRGVDFCEGRAPLFLASPKNKRASESESPAATA